MVVLWLCLFVVFCVCLCLFLCLSVFVSGCGSACLGGCCFGSLVFLYVFWLLLLANRPVFAQVASSRFKPVECEGVCLSWWFCGCVCLLCFVLVFVCFCACLCLSLGVGLLAWVAVVLVAWFSFMFFGCCFWQTARFLPRLPAAGSSQWSVRGCACLGGSVVVFVCCVLCLSLFVCACLCLSLGVGLLAWVAFVLVAWFPFVLLGVAFGKPPGFCPGCQQQVQASGV